MFDVSWKVLDASSAATLQLNYRLERYPKKDFSIVPEMFIHILFDSKIAPLRPSLSLADRYWGREKQSKFRRQTRSPDLRL